MDGVEQTAMQTGLAISEALNLPEVFSTAGEALSEFASAIKEKGLKDALLDLVPPELQMAITALAGAIVAVAIPAHGPAPSAPVREASTCRPMARTPSLLATSAFTMMEVP
jgi:hypothetical protein